MNLKKIKCVVLDFDGTMYSDGDWSNEPILFGDYLVNKNLLPEYPTRDEKLEYLKKRYPNYHIIQQMFAFFHDSGIDDSDFRRFNDENICEIRSEDIVFIKPELISGLAKSYMLYMISDSAIPYLEFYLEHAGIDKRNFKEILSNEYNDEGFTKIPMMKKVLSETGLKPEEIIMVGDSIKSDIVPAKLVGFQTCHVEHVSDTEKILRKLIRAKNSSAKI